MLKVFFLIVFAVLAFVFFVRYLEANSLFHPTREVPVTPASIGLDFDDIYFKTGDSLLLNGWFVKTPAARSTMLFFHGNAGNISHRMEKILMFAKLGLNVFIFDYRGYGKSKGKPNEAGIYKDGLAAYDYLLTRKDVDSSKIVCYGDSLGGVAAVDLATKRKCACLVIDSSFSSLADMTKTIFPFLPAFLLSSKMDSTAKVGGITIPKLFVHSVNDEIVPYALGRKLFAVAAEPKEFLEITGGHNTNHIDSRDVFLSGIKNFLRKLSLL